MNNTLPNAGYPKIKSDKTRLLVRHLVSIYLDLMITGAAGTILYAIISPLLAEGVLLTLVRWATSILPLLLCDIVKDKRSIGKWIMEIRIVPTDGKPLTNGRLIRRKAFLMVFVLIDIVRLVCGFKRFGDLWCNTEVALSSAGR